MYKKIILSISMFVLVIESVNAQEKFLTKTGTIEFFSSATLENIQAKNKTVTTVLDSKTGALQFSVQMKGFEFEKSLMQQHFNETYVESDKYPKAEFRGVITNNKSINYKKNGSYPAVVSGQLTLHGLTKKVEAPGTLKVEAGKLQATSIFNINLSDYNIAIPAKSKEKISNSIKVTVTASLDPFKG